MPPHALRRGAEGWHFHGLFTGVETLASRGVRTKAVHADDAAPSPDEVRRFVMSLTDCRGVPVSTENRTLLNQYERAAELLAGYYVDPFETIQAALEQDPTFAAGHCLRSALIVKNADHNFHAVPGER